MTQMAAKSYTIARGGGGGAIVVRICPASVQTFHLAGGGKRQAINPPPMMTRCHKAAVALSYANHI